MAPTATRPDLGIEEMERRTLTIAFSGQHRPEGRAFNNVEGYRSEGRVIKRSRLRVTFEHVAAFIDLTPTMHVAEGIKYLLIAPRLPEVGGEGGSFQELLLLLYISH